MITNPDLAALADDIGVELRKHSNGPKGLFDLSSMTVSTRRRLPIAQYKSTLAHELGHAHYQDKRVPDGHFHARQERRADSFAASLLLNTSDVETTLTWHNGHLSPAAYELEVSEHLLRIWLQDRFKEN